MSQTAAIQTRFITVTTTISGTPAPVYNSTQLAQIESSKNVGQIIALSGLGIFVLMAIVMLICMGVIRCQRPPPPPMAQNPDAMKRGSEAFLPIIGRKRKSKASLGTAPSTQHFVGGPGGMGARRMSMYAENQELGTVPSPPLFASHSRSSSSNSTIGHGRPYVDSPDSEGEIAHPTGYGYINQYHGDQHMEFIPLDGAPSPPPIVGHVDQTPRVGFAPQVGEGRYSFEESRVSPIEDQRYQDRDRALPTAPGMAFGGSGYEGGVYR